MKKTLKSALIMAIIFVTATFSAKSQNQPGEITDSIYSNELKEMRQIKIRLPENYKPGSAEKFEVAYLTDGEWNMDNFNNIYKFTNGEKFIPDLILVAVPNTYIDGVNMRDRDFLPHQVKDNNRAGGADKFISFLKNELIPYIDKKYPNNGTNSLYGHSYGGLFSMYVLLTHPEAFSTYYCMDPSFWWDNDYLIKLASEKFEKTSELNKTLFVAGIVETLKGMGIDRMDSVLKLKAPKKLYWHIAAFPNETHGSVRLKGIYDGLKFAYDGYLNRTIAFHPMAGIVLKDKPTAVFIYGNYPNLHYNTDGTEPTDSSPSAGQMIQITGPTKLVVKSFGGNKKFGAVSRGDFILGETFPSIKKLKNTNPGGLKYSYYEGIWDSLPDFSKLKPIKTGIADSTFALGKIKSMTNFGCVFEGFLKSESDGYYAFGLDSDDGSKLYLNGKLMVSNDGLHGTGNFKSYVVPLQKGFYPIKIEFFQKEGGLDLQLVYLIPGSQRPTEIPHNLLFYQK